jgi:hypothetical protein
MTEEAIYDCMIVVLPKEEFISDGICKAKSLICAIITFTSLKCLQSSEL